ncbi:MAG: phage tail sheath family protein [Bacteroidia bacterium]|nr:phage tail sheath family protein [Bacteroidia bacterium]
MDPKRPGVYYKMVKSYPEIPGRIKPAVPALIGYTEMAIGPEGEDLTLKPTLISSLEEFHAWFGGGFSPRLTVIMNASGGPVSSIIPEAIFYLYPSLKLFFDNGGREIYIVSVGPYLQGKKPNKVKLNELKDGVDALIPLREPGLILFPDSVWLKHSQLGDLQIHTLKHCRYLQNRFAIFDLKWGSKVKDEVDLFREYVGNEELDLGAAYYPWIKVDYNFPVNLDNLEFKWLKQAPILTGGIKPSRAEAMETAMEIPVSLSKIKVEIPLEIPQQDIPSDSLRSIEKVVPLDSKVALETPLQFSVSTQEVPEGFSQESWQQQIEAQIRIRNEIPLTRETFSPLWNHISQLWADLNSAENSNAQNLIFDLITAISSSLSLLGQIETLSNPPEGLENKLKELRTDEALRNAIRELCSLFEHKAMLKLSGGQAPKVKSLLSSLLIPNWLDSWPAASGRDYFAPVNLEPVVLTPTKGLPIPLAEEPTIETTVARNLGQDGILKGALYTLAQTIQTLYELSGPVSPPKVLPDFSPEVWASLQAQINEYLQIMPPSGAVTGAYVSTDRERGVWKAPANLALERVISPGVRLTAEEQEYLNVHFTGKSVNVIRAFRGRGVMLWGARTLMANSQEWRYVPVRRLFLAAEESLKKALEPYTLEHNSSPTWTRVKALVNGFITYLHRAGALLGETPEESGFVRLGPGESMTQQDILEGKMIVQIGLAAARPAEFIMLTLIMDHET